jgi:hypothetical protein
MSPTDAEREKTEPENEPDPDLLALIRRAGGTDPQLANAIVLVFSALLRTMIEQDKVKQLASTRFPLADDIEPTDAEVEAAARALWRYDLCGMLLYTGEHVLCDDDRLPPYNRRKRCECRKKARATLDAAAGERSQLMPPKPNGGVAKSLATLALAFQKTPAATEATCSLGRDVWVGNAAPSVETGFAVDLGLVAVAEATPVLEAEIEPAMAWQPIDTAPKHHAVEGHRLHHLLYDPKVGVTTGFWLDDAWGRGTWYRTSPSHEMLNPTHWMPLPEPPSN